MEKDDRQLRKCKDNTTIFSRPYDLKSLAEEEMGSISSRDLFNKPRYQKLLEKWCAAVFGLGYERLIGTCKIGVNETSRNVDADFFLEVEGQQFAFQITEAQEEDRRRGQEFKEIEAGTLLSIPYRPEEASRKGAWWIQKAIEKKVKKEYAEARRLSLLVYANFHAPDMQYDKILENVMHLRGKFLSVWIITNSRMCSIFSDMKLGELPGWKQIEI
jgi:hypothetical protein